MSHMESLVLILKSEYFECGLTTIFCYSYCLFMQILSTPPLTTRLFFFYISSHPSLSLIPPDLHDDKISTSSSVGGPPLFPRVWTSYTSFTVFLSRKVRLPSRPVSEMTPSNGSYKVFVLRSHSPHLVRSSYHLPLRQSRRGTSQSCRPETLGNIPETEMRNLSDKNTITERKQTNRLLHPTTFVSVNNP